MRIVTGASGRRDEVLGVMRLIADDLGREAKSLRQASYNDQRLLIRNVFGTGEYSRGIIMLRLVVIDSLYSTNARYSYFAFDEMAERIFDLGGSEKSASAYFSTVARTGEDKKGLFSESYGIKKNLQEGGKQQSLLSKYAYYSLMKEAEHYPLGFPIYDSLVREIYPAACRVLGIRPQRITALTDFKTYLLALSELRGAIFGKSEELFSGYQQFDLLDAYLWRLGKLANGNLSLLMGREDYEKFARAVMSSRLTDPGSFDKKAQMWLRSSRRPFAGLSDEKYLDALVSHWRTHYLVGVK